MIAITTVPTFSAIPSFVPYGVLYWTADTGDLYIGTGSSTPPYVDAVGGGGGGGTATGLSYQGNTVTLTTGGIAWLDGTGNVVTSTASGSNAEISIRAASAATGPGIVAIQSTTGSTTYAVISDAAGNAAAFGGGIYDINISNAAGNAGIRSTAGSGDLALFGVITAPTQSANDNSTKLATTAYVDAEAPAPVASAGDWVMIPCDFWEAQTNASGVPASTSNVYFGQFNLNKRVTFTTASVYVSIAGSAGDKFYVGIYNATTLALIQQITFTSTGSTGAQSQTVTSTTLPPGRYYLVFAGSGTVMGCYGVSFVTQLASAMILNTTKLGYINNPVSAGNLPAVLNSSGSFTANAGIRPPCVLLEP